MSRESVGDLIEQLNPDPWRANNPFSADVAACHEVLFDQSTTRAEKAGALNGWLANHQPCLFGRMEARLKRLTFCILTDYDLEQSDSHIREVIQIERRQWRQIALGGGSHGFLIAAISERIARALPDESLLLLARRLCSLYLGFEEPDEIYLDELALAIKGTKGTEYRRWKVGANYFSSQGDGRWWEDHRIPGGIVFSMNSVGHMARHRAEVIATRRKQKEKADPPLPIERLVNFALPTAMKTIGPPTDGRGTWLLKHGEAPEDKELPDFATRQEYIGSLAGFSPNRYKGLYHTDQTLPSSYFDHTLWQKEQLTEVDGLLFTYLHKSSDPDYESMGLGQLFEEAYSDSDTSSTDTEGET